MTEALLLQPHDKDLGGGFKVRRLLPAAQAALGRPLRVLRPFRPGHRDARQRARRAAASAHRPGHRHLSVRGRDDAPRQPGRGAGDPPRRDQLDDGRPRHRALGAQARAVARRAPTSTTACSCGPRCRRRTRRSSPASRTRAADQIPAVEVQGVRGAGAGGRGLRRALAGARPIRRRSTSTWPCRPARASSCRALAPELAVYRDRRRTCGSTARRCAQHQMAMLPDGQGGVLRGRRRGAHRDHRRRAARWPALHHLELRLQPPRAHPGSRRRLGRAAHGPGAGRDRVHPAAGHPFKVQGQEPDVKTTPV